MNLNCTQRSIIISLLIAVLVYMVMGQTPQAVIVPVREQYIPGPIKTAASAETDGKTIMDLEYDMKCTPGMETGAYYTKSLTPGGLCGDQSFVNAAMHKYSIDEGIGGSLLEK